MRVIKRLILQPQDINLVKNGIVELGGVDLEVVEGQERGKVVPGVDLEVVEGHERGKVVPGVDLEVVEGQERGKVVPGVGVVIADGRGAVDDRHKYDEIINKHYLLSIVVEYGFIHTNTCHYIYMNL